mmetsp:Transcript_27499/g.62230  ORF Transcript_27499/g.62230 Transcript_27499/m.62230 type:complete len:281 (-) Transcript_27499:8-850(-)
MQRKLVRSRRSAEADKRTLAHAVSFKGLERLVVDGRAVGRLEIDDVEATVLVVHEHSVLPRCRGMLQLEITRERPAKRIHRVLPHSVLVHNLSPFLRDQPRCCLCRRCGPRRRQLKLKLLQRLGLGWHVDAAAAAAPLLLILLEAAPEALVRQDDRSARLDMRARMLGVPSFSPHQVCDAERGRARNPARAVDEDGASLGPRALNHVVRLLEVLLDVRLLHVPHVAPRVLHAGLCDTRFQARCQFCKRRDRVRHVQVLAQAGKRGGVGKITQVQEAWDDA